MAHDSTRSDPIGEWRVFRRMDAMRGGPTYTARETLLAAQAPNA